jgi:hypothetical protein
MGQCTSRPLTSGDDYPGQQYPYPDKDYASPHGQQNGFGHAPPRQAAPAATNDTPLVPVSREFLQRSEHKTPDPPFLQSILNRYFPEVVV